MTRWFGVLHVHVQEGESVHQAYHQYRRKRSKPSTYQKLTCGTDPCGCNGPDMCWGKADPYCTVQLEIGGGKFVNVGRTPTMNNNHHPKWNWEMSQVVDLTDEPVFSNEYMTSKFGPHIVVKVMDDDLGGESYDDVLGMAKFPLNEASSAKKPMRVSLTLKHPAAKPNTTSSSKLKVEFRWYPLSGPADCLAVPNTYFKRTHGNMVRLYHDAHSPDNSFSDVPLANGALCKAESAWEDLYEAIWNAKYFVFACGWSINPAITLKRSFAQKIDCITVGDLFKKKADEGVKVVLMVWDDITSRESVGFLKDGIMATYDEYVRETFKNTRVDVAVTKRVAADDVGQIADLLKWSSFTHHQKTVIYDCKNPLDPDSKRVVGAFVGGLDITSGRFDCRHHQLFGTLNNAHADDFYNGCLPGSTVETGPREPWHDIHCRVIGPVAWDVLQNFVERIACQAPKLTGSTALMINELKEKTKIRDGRKVLIDPSDPSAWDVQIFRSIDSEAALFQNRKWLAKFGNESLFVERSIQQAYCYLIDQAKRFIYIENQYFLGSSQYWMEDSDAPCTHLIPYALTKRICTAIEMGEKFTVYVLIPLFPEGPPASASVQEILHWQTNTLKMMYTRIGSKLKEVGNTVCHPRDYLAFFFVGNREPNAQVEVPSGATKEIEQAVMHRRHQIYVHSKMIITDDEYILIGSANINERSMAGCRDTEIAAGSHQPAHRVQKMGDSLVLPRGEVHGFRMHLWDEHFGAVYPEFSDPADLACVRMCNTMADNNWLAYAGEENRALPHGHMCTYPLHVSQDGEVTPIADHPHIPDFACPVSGTKSTILPDAMTT